MASESAFIRKRAMEKVEMLREKTVDDADFEVNWVKRDYYAVAKDECAQLTSRTHSGRRDPGRASGPCPHED